MQPQPCKTSRLPPSPMAPSAQLGTPAPTTHSNTNQPYIQHSVERFVVKIRDTKKSNARRIQHTTNHRGDTPLSYTTKRLYNTVNRVHWTNTFQWKACCRCTNPDHQKQYILSFSFFLIFLCHVNSQCYLRINYKAYTKLQHVTELCQCSKILHEQVFNIRKIFQKLCCRQSPPWKPALTCIVSTAH